MQMVRRAPPHPCVAPSAPRQGAARSLRACRGISGCTGTPEPALTEAGASALAWPHFHRSSPTTELPLGSRRCLVTTDCRWASGGQGGRRHAGHSDYM